MQTNAPRLTVSDPTERPLEGLSDGGHIILSCSNCRAQLMDVWRQRPHEPEVWKLRASCPFCGDKSFVKEIRGGFAQAGFATLKPGTDDQFTQSTKVSTFDTEGDIVVFQIEKTSANAQPVYSRG